MTRDEWCAYAESTPATPAQVGAIVGEFERLGVVDRAERLAISAELLGLENLGSTKHLVMGDAGRLYRMLLDVRDRGELPGVTAAAVDGDQADDDRAGNERITWAEAITRIIIMAYMAFHRKGTAGELADIGLNIEQLRAGGVFTCSDVSQAKDDQRTVN